MDIYKIFNIESARSLPNLPDSHPCKNIHGHSFKIKIIVSGKINKSTGMVIDFDEIDKLFNPIHSLIDHKYLNNIEGLENPSSENLAIWIWEKLKPKLPTITQIEIKETDKTGCIYKGE
tara:strand:- start:377 stop:733 length:357 start_codon:yes stop_codon:yes gene_type:complete